MLKIRFSYTKLEELELAIKALENEFDIISLNKESKSKNPKYANSKYKMAYADIEKKDTI